MESATKSDFDINSVVGVRWGTEYPSYSHQFGFTSLSAGISRRPRRPGDLISQGDAPDRQGPTSASCSSVCGMWAPFRVLGGPRIQSFIDGPWIRLREMSNFCCLPGRAGGIPLW